MTAVLRHLSQLLAVVCHGSYHILDYTINSSSEMDENGRNDRNELCECSLIYRGNAIIAVLGLICS